MRKLKSERIAKMLEKLSVEHVTVNSTKFPDIVKEHGFEHVRTEENGSFILQDRESKKYFRVSANREFEEIESP